MLKRYTFILLAIFCLANIYASPLHAQQDDRSEPHDYKIKINGLADTDVLLAFHYGDKQYIQDTFKLDGEGWLNIKGDTSLYSGLYLVVMPALQNMYFEIIIDEPAFTLETDTADFALGMKVDGSIENKIFYDDLKFLTAQREKQDALNVKLKELDPDSIEAEKIKKDIEAVNQTVKNEREKMFKNHPDALYTGMIKAMQEPVVPEAPLLENGEVDSLFNFRYYKDHFLENLDFSDERLLRTPIIHNLTTSFMDNLTVQTPDSLNKSIDHLVSRTGNSKEVYKYIVISLLNKYANHKLMGMDAVYVHLVENYYTEEKAFWLDEAQLYRIQEKAKATKPLLIGKNAPGLILKDTSGTYRSLYDLKKSYTILYFWDPDCGHCKTETPELHEEYKQMLTDGFDIEVYSVNTQIEFELWIEFIDKHGLDWINVADIDAQNHFRSVYDINSTPQLYLLDSDKKIIAKRLAANQLASFIKDWERITENRKKAGLDN